MQGHGSMIELARKAAALARIEWAARVTATRLVWNYCDVQQRKNRYYAVYLEHRPFVNNNLIIYEQFDLYFFDVWNP